MSKPDTLIDSSRVNFWNPLINAATFVGAGSYLGPDVLAKLGNSIVKWVPTPITSNEFVIGGAFNAAVVSGAEYLSGTDQIEWSFQKGIVATAALVTAALVGPHLFAATSSWTGVVLTSETLLAVAAFDGAFKAVSLGLLYFTHALKESVSPQIPTSVEDVNNVSFFNISTLYDLLKTDSLEWGKLPLDVRTSLNHRFDKEEYTLLPLHGFTQVGTNFSPESLSFLHEKSAKSSDFSVKEHTQMNELFYKNSLEPQTRPHTISELPAQVEVDLAGLEVGKVGDLSLVQLKWIALYYFNYASKHPAKKDLHAALADRMYELGLSSPNPHFASTKALTSPKDIAKPKETEKHLFSWFFAHFTQTKAEWETLSLTDRFQWREAFIRELGKHMLINPPHKEIDLLDQAQLIVLHNQYCTQGRNAWNGLDVRVQEALNAKFL